MNLSGKIAIHLNLSICPSVHKILMERKEEYFHLFLFS